MKGKKIMENLIKKQDDEFDKLFPNKFGKPIPYGKYEQLTGIETQELKNFISKIRKEALEKQKQEIKKMIEGEIKGEGKEWIKMMKNAKLAGFSKMKSPKDFIDGRNYAVDDILEVLNKEK